MPTPGCKELIGERGTNHSRHHDRRGLQEHAKLEQLNYQPKARTQKLSIEVVGHLQYDEENSRTEVKSNQAGSAYCVLGCIDVKYLRVVR